MPDTWPAKGKGRKAKFTQACNVHDYCYGTCKADKDKCDKEFCRNLKLACKQTWPDKADRKRRAGCDDRADLYCAGVIWRATRPTGTRRKKPATAARECLRRPRSHPGDADAAPPGASTSGRCRRHGGCARAPPAGGGRSRVRGLHWPHPAEVLGSSGRERRRGVQCAGKRDHCCSNTKCAGYCRPWQKCDGNGGCDDTAALCTDRDAPRFSKSTPKFCSFQGQEESFCVGKRTKTAGCVSCPGRRAARPSGSARATAATAATSVAARTRYAETREPDCVVTRAGRSARPARQAPSSAANRRRRVASTSRRSRQPVVAERHDTVRRGLLRSEEGRALLSGQSEPDLLPQGPGELKGVCCRKGRENCGDGECAERRRASPARAESAARTGR